MVGPVYDIQSTQVHMTACVKHLSQAWDAGTVGHVLAGAGIALMLLLLVHWGPRRGLEATEVHDTAGRDHVLGTDICQGAFLKSAGSQQVRDGASKGTACMARRLT